MDVAAGEARAVRPKGRTDEKVPCFPIQPQQVCSVLVDGHPRNRPNPMKTALPLLALAALAASAFAEDDAAEIAKKLSNPVASLISVPFQANWDFGSGPLDKGEQFKLNFQPVVPLELNKDWNLIIRTIVPYISQEDVHTGPVPKFPGLPKDILNDFPERVRDDLDRAAEKAFNRAVKKRPVDRHQNGLGDTTQSFFLSPKEGLGGWILGIGPALNYPTATDDLLGSEKWSAGPTLLLLQQKHGWTYGFLSNHLWSFAGDDSRRSVNATFVQPFISYQTKTHTTLGVNSESTYDWNESQWTVPLNVTVSQMLKIGKLPVQLTFGGRYYAEGPSGAPDWGLRAVVTLVLPGGKDKSTAH